MWVGRRWGRGVMMALALALALALVIVAAACSGDGDDDQPAPLAFAPGEVPLPGRQLGDLSLDDVIADPREGQPAPHLGPTTVVRTADGTAAISVIDDAHARNLYVIDPREVGTPGPPVDGQESWVTPGYGAGPLLMPSLVVSLEPGRSLEVASRDLTPEEMARVAADVPRPVPDPGDDAFPGEVIGTLQLGARGLEADIGARWRSHDAEVSVSLWSATAGEQAALKALLYDEPEAQIDLRTVNSCCSPQVMVAPRTRTVRGAEATIATISPFVVTLVLEGDPGLVIFTKPPRAGGSVPLDDQLVEIAEGVTAGTPADVAELVERLAVEDMDRQAARVREAEAEIGWEVLAEHRSSELVVLVTTGESRDYPLLLGPALCALYDRSTEPSCLDAEPMDVPLRLAPSVYRLFFGAVGDEVDAVDLVFPGGTRRAEILELDPPDGLPRRVFVWTIGDDELSTLTDRFDRVDEAVAVARDASGEELARLSLMRRES